MTFQETLVASRRVRLVGGSQTQTVNVCDVNNRRKYDCKVRLPASLPIGLDDFSRFTTVEAMIDKLRDEGGVVEKSPGDSMPQGRSETRKDRPFSVDSLHTPGIAETHHGIDLSSSF